MTTLHFVCCDEQRRAAIDGHPTLNGIDDLEVDDLAVGELDAAETSQYLGAPPSRRDVIRWQRKLLIRFINPLTPTQVAALQAQPPIIEGGTRVRNIRATLLGIGSDSVTIKTSAAGDSSRYVARLVRSQIDLRPPDGIDPVLGEIGFSFKVDCPSDFDCRAGHICLRTAPPEPAIDYLAKDYGSFRRLLLDRLALLVPDWRERNPADLGIALVELLAYVGDRLSYEQDAVATEAYLGTARRRISGRRLAKLVDYAVHDGCNARAWLAIEMAADAVLDPRDFRCFAGGPDLPARIVPASVDEAAALNADGEWFEVVPRDLDPDAAPELIPAFVDHNEMRFYTWGDDRCCLPAGSTAATLQGTHANLAVGDVLVFEEVKGPRTGSAADADPQHRQAVRLTRVQWSDGAGLLVDPLTGIAVTEIEWAAGDRLGFSLCVSARADDASALTDVSVARGNVVLVDHGRTVVDEVLGTVPPSRLSVASGNVDGGCATGPCADLAESPIPPRFRPTLGNGPVARTTTVAVVVNGPAGSRRRAYRFDRSAAASAALRGDPANAQPAMTMASDHNGVIAHWAAVSDLLNSSAAANDFVLETEADGRASVLAGDDEHGRRPLPGERFVATYRVGNGLAGNVGREAIAHAVTGDARVIAVRNPMPASGGVDPETLDEVRRRAPEAFRTQRRAVTPADYEGVATSDPDVQRAAASIRWTGSWPTHFIAIDRLDGADLDQSSRQALGDRVEPFRLAGHDVEFRDPMYVALDVALDVCIEEGYFRGDVKAALLDILSSRRRIDGSLGLFHPDRFSFGQPVYLSPILAAARQVAGVSSADVVVFRRLGSSDTRARDEGQLLLGPNEIARLDNDPDRPDYGRLVVSLAGGQ